MASPKKVLQRRAWRIRRKIKAVANDRLRLSVYRSNMNIYAQIIDDARGHTLAAASSLDPELRKSLKNGGDQNAAKAVGSLLAVRAKKANISEVVFDRGPYLYHGRVKALAEAARDGGIQF